MTRTTISREGVPIRLTDERWCHIVEEHGELAGMREDVLQIVAAAEKVVEGAHGEKMAIKLVERSKALVVVYRELGGHDGFVITAFLTRRLASLDRRNQIWP